MTGNIIFLVTRMLGDIFFKQYKHELFSRHNVAPIRATLFLFLVYRYKNKKSETEDGEDDCDKPKKKH